MPGYSPELVSRDSVNILYKTNFDELEALPFDGIDTALKAFRRNVIRIPNENCLGTRVGDEYQWMTWRDVALNAENFGLGL
jgi:hypothetical protein